MEGGEQKKKNTAETNEGGNCFISAEVAQMGADDARAGIFRERRRLLFIYFGQISPLFSVFSSLRPVHRLYHCRRH